MTDTQTSTPMKGADKVVGYGLIALIGGIGAYALYWVLPFLIELAKNTIIFGIELVVIFVMFLVLADKNTWSAIYYKWKNLSRSIRRAIVREDPIGVLETVISRFAGKLDQIDDNITKAVASRKRHQNAQDKAREQAAEKLSLAKAARNQKRSEAEVKQLAAAAERWTKAADDMTPMAHMLEQIQDNLERARDMCGARLEDLKDQKEVLRVKLDAMQTGQQTVRAFKRFFGHNPDIEMQDMAIQEIERQSTEAEAEIDQFMRVINPILEQQDLKKEAEGQRAMERFSQYLLDAKPVAAIPAVTTEQASKVEILR